MTCMSASTKASKFCLQVSFQSLWSSLVYIDTDCNEGPSGVLMTSVTLTV